MIGPHVRTRAMLNTRVVVGGTAGVTVTDENVAFAVELVPPKAGYSEGAPRSRPPWTIRWRTGLLGPPGAIPGGSSRIMVAAVVYELLGQPKQLMYGRRAVGLEASCLPVDELYPFVGTLTEQSGTQVIAGLPFAMWSPSEQHNAMGEYEDYEAEAPVTYRNMIRRNRQLHMGGTIYRILTTVVDLATPRVTFRIRRAGG